MFGRKPPLAKTFLSHVLIVSVRGKTPGNTNSVSQGFVKRDQASLPFDMRRTKPPLLKHTTSFLFIQTIAIIPFFPRLITAYCYLYSRILERILRLVINLSHEDCSCTLGTRDLFFLKCGRVSCCRLQIDKSSAKGQSHEVVPCWNPRPRL